jgi:hypothetical protein
MPRLWWALTQDELPRPNGGLSKRIKYYIFCLAYARSGGDALRVDNGKTTRATKRLDYMLET